MFPFPIKPGPIPSRYHMHWQYLAQDSADPCIDTLGSWVDRACPSRHKGSPSQPAVPAILVNCLASFEGAAYIPTNHIAWAHVGKSGAEQALIRQVGWLASWSSLAAPARSSSRQGRRESQKIFLEITCIVSTSCELGKCNGFVEPGRAGRSATLTLLLNSSESFHHHRPLD